ncbi:MAG: preprotein translocase subunit SecG [Lachnospiraceae bacterium]|nr:preprotein translocase subunit SecG [Lachnospiraceae bacterium]
MSPLRIVLTIIYAIVCVGLIVVVLLQEGKQAGLGSIGGASSSSDTYWSKNKDRSLEGALPKITKILGVMFVLLSLVLNFKF